MVEWLKKLLHIKKKPIIITIHGFGRRTKHEFDNFALWGKIDGYDILQFDMYDIFNESDYHWQEWVQRAKQQVEIALETKRDIYVIGFSMGGVIAAYLSTIYDFKKLVLIAPAFQYINFEAIQDILKKSAISLFLNNQKKDDIELPKAFYGAFIDIVRNLKKSCEEIPTPTLIIHGAQDEVISTRSSIYAYEKIKHENKKLIILHGGHHRLMMEPSLNWDAYQITRLFFEHKILNTQSHPQATDILETLQKEHN